MRFLWQMVKSNDEFSKLSAHWRSSVVSGGVSLVVLFLSPRENWKYFYCIVASDSVIWYFYTAVQRFNQRYRLCDNCKGFLKWVNVKSLRIKWTSASERLQVFVKYEYAILVNNQDVAEIQCWIFSWCCTLQKSRKDFINVVVYCCTCIGFKMSWATCNSAGLDKN